MLCQRKNYLQKVAESPRIRLRELWLRTMQLASTSGDARINDAKADLHEVVVEMKEWADELSSRTGEYPELEVHEFLDEPDLARQASLVATFKANR